MRQEFFRGDLVRTLPIYWADGIDSSSSDREDYERVRTPAHWAIVVGSYRDQYGGGERERHNYSVLKLNEDGTYDYRWSWLHARHIDYLCVPRCLENLDQLDGYETKEFRE